LSLFTLTNFLNHAYWSSSFCYYGEETNKALLP